MKFRTANRIFLSLQFVVACASSALGALTFYVEPNNPWPSGWYNAAVANMQTTVNMYNAYGNFGSGSIYVYYNSGIPTAQSGYGGSGGSIGDGGTYPNVRVLLHESSHWLGTGTYSSYWTGPAASAMIQQFDGVGAVLNGDSAHYWPYGENYDTESSPINDLRHVAMVYALRKDFGIGSTASPSSATTATLTANDPLGTSAFNYSVWSDNHFAQPGTAYSTGNFLMRTPLDSATPTGTTPSFNFVGDSLTVNNTNGISGGLLFKGVGSSSVLKFNNLIIDGGYVRHASGAGDLCRLGGKMTIAAGGATFHADQGAMQIEAAMSGAGTFNVLADSSGFFVKLLSFQNSFTGNLNIGGRLELGTFANQRFVIGGSGVNNAITGAAQQVNINGIFDLDLSNANTALGNSWTLVSTSNTSYGDTFAVNGFTFDAGKWKNSQGFTFTPTSGVLSVAALPTSNNWVGSTANWSQNANWNAAPTSGNALAFGAAGPAGTTLIDDRMTPATYNVAGITFNAGSPAYTLNPGVAGTNGFSLTAGIVNLGANTQTINDKITVPSARTNFGTSAGGGDLVVNGAINGAGGITKSGPGTLTLSGANTYSSDTRVEGGTLLLTGSLASTGKLSVGGGTFTSARSGTQTVGGLVVLPGTSSVNNGTAGSTLALGAITRYSGGTVSFDTLTGTVTTSTANTNGILGPWALTGVGANAYFATNSSGVIAPYTGAVASTTFGYTSDDTANYQISGIGGALGVPRSANTVRYTGGAGTQTTNSNQLFTFNGLMNAGTGTLSFGNSSFAYNIAAGSSGELILAAESAGITVNNTILDGANGTSVIVLGPSTVTWNGTNTYTGRTTVGSGATLVLAGGASIPDTGPVFVGGGATLSATASETIGSLEGSGSVNTAGTLTVGGANTNTIFSGNISGAGSLTKTGSGVLTLAGANTYAGSTSVSQGAISVSSIATNTGNGATINLGSGSGAGTLIYTGTGEVTSKTLFQSAGAAPNGAILDMSGTGLLRFTSATLGANSSQLHTLTLQGSTAGSGQIDASIQDGSGTNKTSVLKQGTGTWILTGASSYTGGTTVNAGTLSISSNGNLGASGSLTLNGGVLQTTAATNLSRQVSVGASGGAIDVGNSTTTLGSTFAVSGALTKLGSGTLTISGTQAHSAGAVFNANAGVTNFQTDAGPTTSTLLVNANASVNFAATQHLAGLNVGAGASATLTSGGNKLLATNSLSVGTSSLLDLANNDAVILATPATRAAQFASATSKIASAFSNGQWNQPGITSSQAAADSSHLTALGILLNDNGSGGVRMATFDGQSVDANSVLVKYTYYGDANLDGIVNGADFALLDNGFNMGLTGWGNGDFNYDGVINAADYALIDNAFNFQGGALSFGSVTPLIPLGAVPEPSSWMLTLIALGIAAAVRSNS